MEAARAGADSFGCGRCGKRFPWRAALAGRRVRCGCGAVFECPRQRPRADAEEESLYDLVPDAAVAPAPGAGAPPPVPIPARPLPVTAGGAAATVPRPLNYRSAPVRRAPADPQAIKDLWMPLWLLAGGIVIQVVAVFVQLHLGRGARWGGSATESAAVALMAVGMHVVIGTALMLGGVMVAAKLRGIDFGRSWVAVFKLSAISVAPAALQSLLEPALAFVPLGFLLAWLGSFILYFALIGALFDLDQSDTWYCVWVIFLVKLAVFFTLVLTGCSLMA